MPSFVNPARVVATPRRNEYLSLAKTLGVLSFTPLTMLQPCAQAVDFKVGHHFGEGQQRFDASLFTDPSANGIRPGNASRGSILGPGAWRWDASLFKNTNISESVTVQFRAEATNVLNHTNFDSIGTLFLFDPIHFGQVVSARDPRVIQLGLKLKF